MFTRGLITAATLVVGVALETAASAQPQPNVDPAPPVEPAPAAPAAVEPPPAAPAAAEPIELPAGHDMAMRMTNAAHLAASSGNCAPIDALDQRVRALDSEYYEKVFATDATISRCLPDRPTGPVVVAEPGARRRWFTFEAAVGAAAELGTGFGIGGPAFGIGGFVTPDVSLSVRVSGMNLFFFYAGVLGPNAQVWVSDTGWLGGGAGLGFALGCFDGCGAQAGFGADARIGHAFQPRGQSGPYVSIESALEVLRQGEFNRFHAFDSISLMLGYQTF